MAGRRGIFGENKVHFQAVGGDIVGNQFAVVLLGDVLGNAERSEERRVGKECRSRWSPYH